MPFFSRTLMVFLFLLSLTGSHEVGAGQLSATPIAHNFNKLKVGDTLSQTFVITNLEKSSIALENPRLVGASASEFKFATQTCAILTSLESCLIEVLFTPTTSGSKSVQLELFAAGLTLLTIPLTGVGEGGECATMTPSYQDFGPIMVNQSSPNQLFTLTNQCDPNLNITTVRLVGTDANQFKLGTDTCSGRRITPIEGTIPTGEGSCVVEASFQPTSSGSKTAFISISYDNSETKVSLLGRVPVTIPDIVIEPTTLIFTIQ